MTYLEQLEGWQWGVPVRAEQCCPDCRPCPVCHGTGLVVVLLQGEPVEMQCGECLGTGEQDDDAALREGPPAHEPHCWRQP